MIVGRCTAAGCNVLTIGPRCVAHDVPVTRTFTRGRPFAQRGSAPAVPPAPIAPARAADLAVVHSTGAVLVRAS
jgi:hypothetical protein